MIPRCVVCGSRSIDPKYTSAKTKKLFCSKDCVLIENFKRLFILGILILLITIIPSIGIIFLIINEAPDLFYIPIILMVGGVLFGGYILYTSWKGRNLEKQRNLQAENLIYSCVFCGSEYEKRIYGGPTICSNCGEKSPYCDLCFDYIFAGKPVYRLQKCGHIFHKTELLDYLENKEICPKCRLEIRSIDLMIDK